MPIYKHGTPRAENRDSLNPYLAPGTPSVGHRAATVSPERRSRARPLEPDVRSGIHRGEFHSGRRARSRREAGRLGGQNVVGAPLNASVRGERPKPGIPSGVSVRVGRSSCRHVLLAAGFQKRSGILLPRCLVIIGSPAKRLGRARWPENLQGARLQAPLPLALRRAVDEGIGLDGLDVDVLMPIVR